MDWKKQRRCGWIHVEKYLVAKTPIYLPIYYAVDTRQYKLPKVVVIIRGDLWLMSEQEKVELQSKSDDGSPVHGLAGYAGMLYTTHSQPFLVP